MDASRRRLARTMRPYVFSWPWRGRAVLVLAIWVGWSCRGAEQPPSVPVPGTEVLPAISAAVGSSQTVSLTVVNDRGSPISGIFVLFNVTGGGGSVTPSAATDAQGIARATWSLGTASGLQSLQATAGARTYLFNATATAGPAAQLTPVTGTSTQFGFPLTPVTSPPAVHVADQFGNAVAQAGRSVTFSVSSGGGIVTPATVTTDANGRAAVTSWILGAAAGAHTVTATSAGLTSATFVAVAATVEPALGLIPLSSTSQTGSPGLPVSTRPSVRVLDVSNNPVPNVSVTFAVTSGGGSVTGATQVSNAAGVATVGSWTLGSTPGVNTLTATASGGLGSVVTFTATAVIGGSATGAATAAPLRPRVPERP